MKFSPVATAALRKDRFSAVSASRLVPRPIRFSRWFPSAIVRGVAAMNPFSRGACRPGRLGHIETEGAPALRDRPGPSGRDPASVRRFCEHAFVRWDNLTVDGKEAEAKLPGFREPAVIRTFEAPEALGTRFYEVQARSALNRVPKRSRM